MQFLPSYCYQWYRGTSGEPKGDFSIPSYSVLVSFTAAVVESSISIARKNRTKQDCQQALLQAGSHELNVWPVVGPWFSCKSEFRPNFCLNSGLGLKNGNKNFPHFLLKLNLWSPPNGAFTHYRTLQHLNRIVCLCPIYCDFSKPCIGFWLNIEFLEKTEVILGDLLVSLQLQVQSFNCGRGSTNLSTICRYMPDCYHGDFQIQTKQKGARFEFSGVAFY